MRARYILPFGGLCALLPLLYFLAPIPQRPDNIGEFSGWSPTESEIAKAVGSGPSGSFTDDRHTKFGRMFQQRFRNKEIAVALRFTGEDRAKLSCAAFIPRWDMARVAVAAHKEIKQAFGRPVTVDIYETYISLLPRKLAELHEDPATGHITVDFDPKYAAAEAVLRMLSRYSPIVYFNPAFYANGAFWGRFRSRALFGARPPQLSSRPMRAVAPSSFAPMMRPMRPPQ